ncbi:MULTISPECIES: hypothetical protein [unclassified Leptolyngbya]|uniref:hypothetical protein n=1 Tax=unclassified Leptolyngbya TaxID=2650499 RepID=UPI001687580C|nr:MULTISPECIES: hypothetical protein [unclassified Leptolyngbya]MBD1911332.1 hypothetical protein [Leptolyngbya sp. FACHB-8]MBD2156650.1 hypothetical protein [Leptolyngbya sp. FACHB-16]
MNRFLTAIATVATLTLIQSCSSLNTQQTATTPSTEQHSDAHGTSSNAHSSHAVEEDVAQAKLIMTDTPVPNQAINLGIHIQDGKGEAIAQFDTFQEKIMHLIVVSNDLQFFNHLHPQYQGNGLFEVQARFPKAGGYTLFSDYKPSGHPEQVSVLTTEITGDVQPPPDIHFDRTQTIANTHVHLELSEDTVAAGQDMTLTFHLSDLDRQPVTDLQPYLGEGGHLVIIRQSTPLTRANYIHAHAVDETTGQVQFHTQFPEPGRYKLWGQFNRNGEIITAEFWVNVS